MPTMRRLPRLRRNGVVMHAMLALMADMHANREAFAACLADVWKGSARSTCQETMPAVSVSHTSPFTWRRNARVVNLLKELMSR